LNWLNDLLEHMPEKNIPEMRFLAFSDWMSVTLNNGLETEAKVTLALAQLREKAKLKPELFKNIPEAIRAYSKEHEGRSVTEIAQLRPYLNPPLDDDILQRYALVPVTASFWPDRPITSGIGQSTLMERAVVDEDYDVLVEYSDGGSNLQIVSRLGRIVGAATTAFEKANKGQEPTAADQLLPYVAGPVDKTSSRNSGRRAEDEHAHQNTAGDLPPIGHRRGLSGSRTFPPAHPVAGVGSKNGGVEHPN
jgi:hypothetical protein